MAVSLEVLVLQVIVFTIIIGPILWIAGRILVGKEKARFTDGLVTVALATIVWGILSYLNLGWITWIVWVIVVWALIKHFFDCGWLKALLIAIVAGIILIVIVVVLGFVLVALGFGALTSLLPSLGAL